MSHLLRLLIRCMIVMCLGTICEKVTCPPGKHCVSSGKYRPECVCSTMCPALYFPVCGSDKKTYVNTCELNVTACQTNTNITVAHYGKC